MVTCGFILHIEPWAKLCCAFVSENLSMRKIQKETWQNEDQFCTISPLLLAAQRSKTCLDQLFLKDDLNVLVCISFWIFDYTMEILSFSLL